MGQALFVVNLEPRKMRGIDSEGMLCSAEELGLEASWFEDGILQLDADTPLEETAGALASAVQQGKALYIGISSYSAAKTLEMTKLLAEYKVPLLIHQPAYNMLNRWIEHELLDTLEQVGAGAIAFTPLAQGWQR